MCPDKPKHISICLEGSTPEDWFYNSPLNIYRAQRTFFLISLISWENHSPCVQFCPEWGNGFMRSFCPSQTQTFATLPANVCNRPRKRLHPRSQTFASKTPFWRGMNVHQRTAEESLVSTPCFLLLASGDLHRLSADSSCPVRIDVWKAKRSKRLR